MPDTRSITTFLFSDIEGSTRLWEQAPEAMTRALAAHDALARSAILEHRGVLVKTTGDGVHAAFDDPLDALLAALRLQRELPAVSEREGVALRVRCGVHGGDTERRDSDFYGTPVNRAARVMSVAHGGQVLASEWVAHRVGARLPTGLALRDLGLVRLKDLADAERVYQLVHPDLRSEFPPPRSLDAVPNNLPQQATSFVGREDLLAEARALLRRTRLLTLQGAGGLGKTRLSLQLAAEVLDDFPDGVWLVELAPLRDVPRVAQAAAAVLGVREEPGRPVLEALVRHVRERQLLLVLDNCEHLIAPCAALVQQLLQAAPRLTVLATSREPLHLRAETCCPVPPLPAPASDAPLTASTLQQFAAVQLFVDRALAAVPHFEVTDANAAAIADICRRVDGIPLAIELAAARLRALSVGEIAARLDDRFRLLVNRDPTAQPRQRTLRALIEWSHDLLDANERRLFARLAAFAGSFTLDAAEAITADDALDRAEVADVLACLVEKSLVARDADVERYRLLETVREYAQERLGDEADAARLHERFLRHYVAVAEAALPELFGPRQAEWLARLDLDRENFLAAHRWRGAAADDGEHALRLASALKPYFLSRGLLLFGRRLLVEALETAAARDDLDIAKCRARLDAGQLSYYMGRYAEALPYLEAVLASARELQHKRMLAAVLQPLGMACLGEGRLDAARTHLAEALAVAETLDDPPVLLFARSAMGQLCRVEGDLDAAETLCGQAVALARDIGHDESLAFALLNLAMAASMRSERERAAAVVLEALDIAQRSASRPVGQSALEVAAGLAAEAADWTTAGCLWGAATEQARQTGVQRDPADAAFLVPRLDQARRAAASALDAALADGARLPLAAALARARSWLEGATATRAAASTIRTG